MKKTNSKKPSAFGTIWGWARPYRGKFMISIVLAILGVACQMIPYFCVTDIVIQMIAGEHRFSSYLVLCITALIGYLAKVLFSNLSTVISHTAAYDTLRGLREHIVQKLARVPMGTVLLTPSGQYKSCLLYTSPSPRDCS